MSVRTWCKQHGRSGFTPARVVRGGLILLTHWPPAASQVLLGCQGAVTVVLTLIIAGINIVNYSHVCKMADALLDYILAARTVSIGGTT